MSKTTKVTPFIYNALQKAGDCIESKTFTDNKNEYRVIKYYTGVFFLIWRKDNQFFVKELLDKVIVKYEIKNLDTLFEKPAKTDESIHQTEWIE